MSEGGSASDDRPFLVSLFSIMGRIGPGRYWLSILCAAGLLIATMMFAATAMMPTGGDATVFLAFPLFAAFVWVLGAAMAQRLRDAGKHPALAILFLILLIGMLYLAIELIEVAPTLGLIGLIAILAFVGHIDAILKLRQDPA